MPPALEPFGDDGLRFMEIIPRIDGLESLPIDLATGKAGDVYFCHPFLVHAANWPHSGSKPRFISQPGLAPEEEISLVRSDGSYSLVERAILSGLNRSHGGLGRRGAPND